MPRLRGVGQASCGDQYRSWPLDPISYPYPEDLKVFWGSLVVLLRWIFFGAAEIQIPASQTSQIWRA